MSASFNSRGGVDQSTGHLESNVGALIIRIGVLRALYTMIIIRNPKIVQVIIQAPIFAKPTRSKACCSSELSSEGLSGSL